jgi:hypothetical protein
MTETRHICDKCKNVIIENRTLLKAEAGPLRLTTESQFDLCMDCVAQFRGWLRSGAPSMPEALTAAEARR